VAVLAMLDLVALFCIRERFDRLNLRNFDQSGDVNR
jgi:hypothetical protein